MALLKGQNKTSCLSRRGRACNYGSKRNKISIVDSCQLTLNAPTRKLELIVFLFIKNFNAGGYLAHVYVMAINIGGKHMLENGSRST